MFSSEFKERSSDELTLPDKEYANVLEFLCCIYPGVGDPVTVSIRIHNIEQNS